MLRLTDDLRIDRLKPLIPPAILMEQYPITETASVTVAEGREAVTRILRGQDYRLVVVVGPCSIHDVAAARDYGRHLKGAADRLRGSFMINEGLGLARSLLLDLADLGLGVGCEFLETITPQFIRPPPDPRRRD